MTGRRITGGVMTGWFLIGRVVTGWLGVVAIVVAVLFLRYGFGWSLLAAGIAGISMWGALALAFFAWFAFQTRSRRPEPGFDYYRGFEYIYVEDDGSAREVNAAERERLTTKLEPPSGFYSPPPYIKFNYESLSHEGRLGGYLLRRQLPKSIRIGPEPPRV